MFKLIICGVICLSICSMITVVTGNCAQCDSSSDGNCVHSPNTLLGTACANTSSTCYSRILPSGQTARGCTFELDPEVQASCTNLTAIVQTLCLTCVSINMGEPCNNQIHPVHRIQCHQCNTDVNSTCGFNMTSSPITCPLYSPNDRCFIRRFDDRIERGCLSSTNECPNENVCFLCDGNGCNSQDASDPVIPSHGITLNNSLLTSSFIVLVTIIKTII